MGADRRAARAAAPSRARPTERASDRAPQPRDAAGQEPEARHERVGIFGRLKRLALLSLMSVVTLNVWTGSPLMALWVGSRVQGSGPPTMGAIGAVALTMGVISGVLVKLLSGLGAYYDKITGKQPEIRQHVPWLRSLRGERPKEQGEKVGLSAVEVIAIAAVMIVVAAFEIWFFFYSSSPIDQRSGR